MGEAAEDELNGAYLAGHDLAQRLTACPFSNPAYYLDSGEPCPVCGALGDDDSAEEKCVDNHR